MKFTEKQGGTESIYARTHFACYFAAMTQRELAQAVAIVALAGDYEQVTYLSVSFRQSCFIKKIFFFFIGGAAIMKLSFAIRYGSVTRERGLCQNYLLPLQSLFFFLLHKYQNEKRFILSKVARYGLFEKKCRFKKYYTTHTQEKIFHIFGFSSYLLLLSKIFN